jgi:lipoprotein-releasing system permease protein
MRSRAKAPLTAFPYYQGFLSFRYLKSRFSALAALSSMAFGVAVIVVVLSIMGGYIAELKESIRGQESHLTIRGSRPFGVTGITALERLVEGVDDVVATAPFIQSLAMYRSGKFDPCYLKGVAPDRQARVSSLGSYVLRPKELADFLDRARLDEAGSADSVARSGMPSAARDVDRILHSPTRAPLDGAELDACFRRDWGLRLLEERNPTLVADLKDRIPPSCLVGIHQLLDHKMFLGQVITVLTVQPGTSQPLSRKFLVAGAFKTGDFDADSQTVYVHIDTLKNMLGLFDPKSNGYSYDGLRVAVRDLANLKRTKEAVEAALREAPDPAHRGLEVIAWEKMRSNLLSAVAIEKFVIYFLLVLLVGFTACMVLLMLLLTVIEKTRDIGVLLSLGATPMGVVRVFLSNGLVLSAAGTTLGLALGYLFCAYINPLHDWIHAMTGMRLFPAEIYHMDRIPIAYAPTDVLLSVGPPIVLGFLASLAPAIWAARRDPIKAIHHE